VLASHFQGDLDHSPFAIRESYALGRERRFDFALPRNKYVVPSFAGERLASSHYWKITPDGWYLLPILVENVGFQFLSLRQPFRDQPSPLCFQCSQSANIGGHSRPNLRTAVS
jgi:hypothetical protein